MKFIYHMLSFLSVSILVLCTFSFFSNWSALRNYEDSLAFVSFKDFKYITDSLNVLTERSDSVELQNNLKRIASETTKDLSFLEDNYKSVVEASKGQLSSNLYMTGGATLFSLIMVVTLAVCKKRFCR